MVNLLEFVGKLDVTIATIFRLSLLTTHVAFPIGLG